MPKFIYPESLVMQVSGLKRNSSDFIWPPGARVSLKCISCIFIKRHGIMPCSTQVAQAADLSLKRLASVGSRRQRALPYIPVSEIVYLHLIFHLHVEAKQYFLCQHCNNKKGDGPRGDRQTVYSQYCNTLGTKQGNNFFIFCLFVGRNIFLPFIGRVFQLLPFPPIKSTLPIDPQAWPRITRRRRRESSSLSRHSRAALLSLPLPLLPARAAIRSSHQLLGSVHPCRRGANCKRRR